MPEWPWCVLRYIDTFKRKQSEDVKKHFQKPMNSNLVQDSIVALACPPPKQCTPFFLFFSQILRWMKYDRLRWGGKWRCYWTVEETKRLMHVVIRIGPLYRRCWSCDYIIDPSCTHLTGFFSHPLLSLFRTTREICSGLRPFIATPPHIMDRKGGVQALDMQCSVQHLYALPPFLPLAFYYPTQKMDSLIAKYDISSTFSPGQCL